MTVRFGLNTRRTFIGLSVGLTLCGLEVVQGHAEDWWQFRGPKAGHVAEKDVPTVWGGFFHDPVWRTHIPGKG